MDTRVLIISHDPMIAALLGVMVEVAGHEVVHADAAPTLDEVLLRSRPTVVLVDVDDPHGASDAFLARAQSIGAQVILFSPCRLADDVQASAAPRALPWFTMPMDRRTFAALLARARDGDRRGSSGRARPVTSGRRDDGAHPGLSPRVGEATDGSPGRGADSSPALGSTLAVIPGKRSD